MTTILDDKNLSTAGYTNLNTIFVNDQHNPGAGGEGNGTTSRLHKAGVLASGVTDFSGIFWLKMNAPSSDVFPISQFDSSGLQGFFLSIESSGRLSVQALTSITEFSVSRSNPLVVDITDDVYHRVGFSVEANTAGVADADLNLYVDGLEISSYDVNNSHGGTGWQSVTATAAAQQISLLSAQHFARFVDGIISRPFMTDTVLSAGDFLTDFNAEVAAIGEGFGDLDDGSLYLNNGSLYLANDSLYLDNGSLYLD